MSMVQEVGSLREQVWCKVVKPWP